MTYYIAFCDRRRLFTDPEENVRTLDNKFDSPIDMDVTSKQES